MEDWEEREGCTTADRGGVRGAEARRWRERERGGEQERETERERERERERQSDKEGEREKEIVSARKITLKLMEAKPAWI